MYRSISFLNLSRSVTLIVMVCFDVLVFVDTLTIVLPLPVNPSLILLMYIFSIILLGALTMWSAQRGRTCATTRFDQISLGRSSSR